MATFLSTPKMSPELVARLERRLSKRRAKSKLTEDFGRSRSSAVRVMVLLATIAVVAGYYVVQARETRELEQRRSELMRALGQRRSELPPGFAALLPKVERWAAEAARDVEGDQVATEMRTKTSRDAWLGRRSLYVRGTAAELRKAATLPNAAAASDKDAFLFCLFRPPASRADADVLDRVRGVNFGGAIVGDATKNVRRLNDAFNGLKVVGKGFEDKILAADSERTVHKLAVQFDRISAPLLKESAGAELLLVVVDDGPRARAVFVDLVSDRLLLRIQRRTDTARASAAQKLHAADLAACELALDARAVE